ncbi:MAG: hypothetical protein ACSLE5_04605, partial [Porticoccaceae bacterium]
MASELRAWYLATLGVVTYRLRAAASPSVASVDDAGSGHSPLLEPSEEAPSPRDIRGQAPPMDRVVRTSTVDVRKAPPSRPAEPILAVDSLRDLRLACWQPVPALLVLDSVPRGRAPSADRVQLLMNILRALGRQPASLSAAEFIDWPMTADADCTHARTLLAMFLLGRFERNPFSWVLAMGEAATLLLADAVIVGDGNDWRTWWGRRRDLATGATAVFTPGLGD